MAGAVETDEPAETAPVIVTVETGGATETDAPTEGATEAAGAVEAAAVAVALAEGQAALATQQAAEIILENERATSWQEERIKALEMSQANLATALEAMTETANRLEAALSILQASPEPEEATETEPTEPTEAEKPPSESAGARQEAETNPSLAPKRRRWI